MTPNPSNPAQPSTPPSHLDRGLLADAILTTALDCIIVSDDAGRIVEFNPAAERTFGWTRAQVLNRQMDDTIVPHHHRAAHRHGMSRYLSGGEAHVLGRRVEVEGLHATGRVFPLELTITETVMQGHRFFVATLRDLSEKRAAEDDLLQARASLQAIFDNIPAALYLRDRQDNLVMINAWGARFLGRDPAEMIGKPMSQFRENQNHDGVREADDKIARTGQPETREFTYHLPGGDRIGLMTFFPVSDGKGEVIQIGGMLIDVTELHLARTELQTARAGLQAFFDHAPVGVFINRLGTGGITDQVVEFANDRAGKPYDLTAPQLIGTHSDDPRRDAAMRATLLAMDAEIVQTRQPAYIEVLNPASGLHEGHSRFPILNAAGKITHIGGMVLDIDDRVRARQQLDEVSAHLESIYDNVPANLYIRELDGTFVTANQWTLNFLGITKDDLPTIKAWSADDDEDHRISLQAQAELLATGKPVTREFHQINSDAVIMNTIFPVRNAEGQITRIGGFSTDISELHAARVALQQERANLQAFFDQVPVGIHMNRIGAHGIEDQTVDLANDNIARPYGLTAAQFIHRNPYAMAADQGILPIARAFDQQILTTRKPVHTEALNPATGKHESYTRFPILNAAGQITHIGGMVIDIDELVRAKDQLEEVRTLLSSIFDNVPAVLYLREIDGTFIMVNAFGAAVLGTGDPAQTVGRSAHTLDSVDEAETAASAQATVLATGQPMTQEYIRQVGGRTITVLNTIFPVRDASGAIMRIGGFATDVTELYNARNQLQLAQESLHQSEKLAALGQLLAGVAHELNNPLAVVLGRAAILQEKLTGTPHEAPLQKLREAANRCARIVKTFLAMARQTGPRRQLVEVNELIESALEMTTYGLRSAGITWTSAPLAQGMQIEADQDQIVQVLINLILNAQHAVQGQTGGPRRIELGTTLTPDRRWLHITVADSGPGVPAAIAHRIFDPFFTTKPVGQGTGLGLSVCKSMIEAHGGKLDLTDNPGGGALFRITLPTLISGTAEAGDDTQSTPMTQRRGRFLVVDDEVEIAAILADCLAPLGIECVIASDGAAGLQCLAEGRFDAVFCDVNMPGMDGVTFYQHLRDRDPVLARHLVFVSGDVLHRDWDRVKAVGDRPAIEKPFDPRLVRETALRLLDDQGTLP